MSPHNATYPVAVLVVDDCLFFLKYTGAILCKAGFNVLLAASPGEALEIESIYAGTIGLLLSDVDMPEMTGPDLAATLTARRRGMGVLLMSACDASRRPPLQPGWRFIPKPFEPEALAGMVSDALPFGGSGVPEVFESGSRCNPMSVGATEPSGALYV